jgi:hypothetical protein
MNNMIYNSKSDTILIFNFAAVPPTYLKFNICIAAKCKLIYYLFLFFYLPSVFIRYKISKLDDI